MRLITKLRKKLYRLGVPPQRRHMRKLHPDFRLYANDPIAGAYGIYWKGTKIGATQPLAALARPASKTCFIIASGPSIADLDLGRLRHRVCFGVNGSIVKSAEYGIPFTYHIVTDKNFARDRFELVKQIIGSGADCLFTFRVLNEISERELSLLGSDRLFLLEEMNAVYGLDKLSPAAFDAWAEGQADLILHDTERLKSGWVGFSKRIERGVFTGQTVVFAAVQVAYWLGFQRVFILGMDLGGTGTLARFYESGSAVASSRLDKDFKPYIIPAFELARRLFEAEGREIYNVSPNSRLPTTIIPKLSFDEALVLSNN